MSNFAEGLQLFEDQQSEPIKLEYRLFYSRLTDQLIRLETCEVTAKTTESYIVLTDEEHEVVSLAHYEVKNNKLLLKDKEDLNCIYLEKVTKLKKGNVYLTPPHNPYYCYNTVTVRQPRRFKMNPATDYYQNKGVDDE